MRRRTRAAHRGRNDDRHTGVHVAGTGRGPRGRRPLRHLQLRLGPVRDGRPAARLRGAAAAVLGKILNEEPAPPRTQRPRSRSTSKRRSCAACARIPRVAIQTMADLKVRWKISWRIRRVSGADGRCRRHPHSRRPVPATVVGRCDCCLPCSRSAGYLAWRAAATFAQSERRARCRRVPLTALSGQVRYPTFVARRRPRSSFSWNGRPGGQSSIYVQQIGAGAPLRLTTDPANDSSPGLVARRPRNGLSAPPRNHDEARGPRHPAPSAEPIATSRTSSYRVRFIDQSRLRGAPTRRASWFLTKPLEARPTRFS